ncbi:MAG: type II toxin-antitoxin system antitoxin SocA domain-containing protein [bacterium]
MTKKLSKYIVKLRRENNYSQEFLAEKIGISRPTYMQIEKGLRDLTITEARTLAGIFGLSLDGFLEMDSPSGYNVQIKAKKKKPPTKQDIRISVPQERVEKFKQALLYILQKVGARPNVGETVLYKLLYFIDFDYYEKYEEQLIGARYIKNIHGPTPVAFKKIFEQMEQEGQATKVRSKYFQYDQKKYLPLISPDLTVFTAREIVHIDDVLNRLAGKTGKELSDYSHKDTPWLTSEMGKQLSYESVFYRDSDHSVKEYEDEL